MEIFIPITIVIIIVLLCVVVYQYRMLGNKKSEPKRGGTEQDLLEAILSGVAADEWAVDKYGNEKVMANKLTRKKIYIEGTLSGMFCEASYRWEDSRCGDKIVQAFKEHAGLVVTGWTAIEAVTGHKYEPPDDVDPAVVKEAKKNLKLWTR